MKIKSRRLSCFDGKRGAPKPLCGDSWSWNIGPGKLNFNTLGTILNPTQAYRNILQHVGARPLGKVDQALLKGL